jgi:hypothetical protein
MNPNSWLLWHMYILVLLIVKTLACEDTEGYDPSSLELIVKDFTSAPGHYAAPLPAGEIFLKVSNDGQTYDAEGVADDDSAPMLNKVWLLDAAKEPVSYTIDSIVGATGIWTESSRTWHFVNTAGDTLDEVALASCDHGQVAGFKLNDEVDFKDGFGMVVTVAAEVHYFGYSTGNPANPQGNYIDTIRICELGSGHPKDCTGWGEYADAVNTEIIYTSDGPSASPTSSTASPTTFLDSFSPPPPLPSHTASPSASPLSDSYSAAPKAIFSSTLVMIMAPVFFYKVVGSFLM